MSLVNSTLVWIQYGNSANSEIINIEVGGSSIKHQVVAWTEEGRLYIWSTVIKQQSLYACAFLHQVKEEYHIQVAITPFAQSRY